MDAPRSRTVQRTGRTAARGSQAWWTAARQGSEDALGQIVDGAQPAALAGRARRRAERRAMPRMCCRRCGCAWSPTWTASTTRPR